ncbi:secreted PhoX family phosphatase [Arthrobacter pigmenti]|uniref:Secreted PhoX family phosphatase n=1 Tax=Arthrobacter pigmenti TaxID=271432 RepID=A0A846RYS6_9MICC|nr:alkaline phosphatase PhoX [Arthrobacter pigmenti]NJC24116.1 secreted PhoX family phosphatase [Arthrobacter pigmenti]
MNARVSRRTFLGGAAAAGLGVTFAGCGSLEPFSRPSGVSSIRTAAGYGPLIPDPEGILALPEGFSYQLVARSGETTTDDGVHPSDPDGMGVFANGDGGWTLVTNHENDGDEPHPVPVVEGLTYDPGAIGGTSTITVDPVGKRLAQYTSLAGTDNNCAGGITPWAHG